MGEKYLFTQMQATHTHTHCIQVHYMCSGWHSGKFNTSLSTVGGKEIAARQRKKMESRQRKESNPAHVAAGSTA